MPALSLEAAERLFFWSNALYVLGALLTLGTAALLIQANRMPAASAWAPRLNPNVLLAPAIVCVLGTVAAIGFSNFVLDRERASFDRYKLQVASELSRLRYNVEVDRAAVGQDSLLQGARQRPGPNAAGGVSSPASLDGVADNRDARELDLGPAAGGSLRSYQGMRAVVESSPSDTEASQFASHLLLLLIANGIDAREGREDSVLHSLAGEPGIHVRYKDPDGGHELAAALASVLRARGLHVDVAPSWDVAARVDSSLNKGGKDPVTRDQLLVSIGPKPR